MSLLHWKIVWGIFFPNIRKEVQTKTCQHIEFGKKDCMTE